MKTKQVESLNKDTEKLVREIFQRRADGQQQNRIAKALGVKPWFISDVLHRKTHSDVTIGHDVLMKVQERYPKRKRSGPKAKARAVGGPPIAELLVSYTSATENMLKSRAACIKAGVSEDTMKLLRAALEESLG